MLEDNMALQSQIHFGVTVIRAIFDKVPQCTRKTSINTLQFSQTLLRKEGSQTESCLVTLCHKRDNSITRPTITLGYHFQPCGLLNMEKPIYRFGIRQFSHEVNTHLTTDPNKHIAVLKAKHFSKGSRRLTPCHRFP